MPPSLGAEIATHQAALRALRHDIHRWPEPGFEETETRARILAALTPLGLRPRDCARTGLVVDLGQALPGRPSVALRADIDALRMTEDNPDLPHRSQRPGLAHMCGHDGHTAALVGVAALLAPVASQLQGRVRLLFQPAEEGPGGAPVMIEDGALDGVDEVYGMHNWPTAPLGELRTIAGPCMATVARMQIAVRGRGGHASQPQDAIDPIVAAAQVVSSLQTVVSRNVHYQDSVVLSITTIHGGEVFNVIPDTVTLQGTVRAFSDAAMDLVEARMRALAAGVAGAHGCTVELDFERVYPVLVNTPAETAHVERVGRQVLGQQAVSSALLPMTGAEDFAYFLQARPGCFFFLGGGAPGRSNSMCHATDFDFNDDLIPVAMRFWARLVEDRLGQTLWSD